jgi:GT2 family glycosyltransferase
VAQSARDSSGASEKAGQAMRPRVSICIPSHRPELAGEAIRSAQAQEGADCSIHLLQHSTWWSEKINDLVYSSFAEYIVILPDDDLLAPTYIARTLAELERHPEWGIAYTDHRLFGDRDEVYRAGSWTHEDFRRGNPVLGMTALIRRQVWMTHAGFDPAQTYQDWDFFYRCYKAGVRAVRIQEPLLHYRYHADKQTPDDATARALLFKKHPALLTSEYRG